MRSKCTVTLWFCLLVSIAHAQSNSDTDTDRRGWVKPPTFRGTINIISACLSTLFICLYAAFHDDVPISNSSKLARLLRKARWMLIGIFAPEFIVILAGLQFYEARASVKEMRDLGIMNWTITHGYFANMGGFVLVSSTYVKIPADIDKLLLLFKARPPAEWWPRVSRDAIVDKSKADFLAKFLALLQAIWLVAQIIGRAVGHLSISPLEIESAAYVPLTLVVYVLWWAKPLNVEVPIEIPVGDVDLNEIYSLNPLTSDSKRAEWRDIVTHLSGASFGSNASATIVMFLGMIFGGVHCLAWHFSFPTGIEAWLWRTASVMTVIGGFFAHSIVAMISRTLRGHGLPPREGTGFSVWVLRAWDVAGYPIFLVYFLARWFSGLSMFHISNAIVWTYIRNLIYSPPDVA